MKRYSYVMACMLIVALGTTRALHATPEEDVKKAVDRYKRQFDPQRNTLQPLLSWLQEYRTVYPLTRRALPIKLIDKLSAQDIMLIQELQTIALKAKYLVCQSQALPKLTAAGMRLYGVAEKHIKELQQSIVTKSRPAPSKQSARRVPGAA